MFKTIVIKEFQENIRDSRFVVAMLLCMIIIPLGFFINAKDYQAKEQNDRDSVRLYDDSHKMVIDVMRLGGAAFRPSSPLSMLSGGVEHLLPTSVETVGYITNMGRSDSIRQYPEPRQPPVIPLRPHRPVVHRRRHHVAAGHALHLQQHRRRKRETDPEPDHGRTPRRETRGHAGQDDRRICTSSASVFLLGILLGLFRPHDHGARDLLRRRPCSGVPSLGVAASLALHPRFFEPSDFSSPV